MCYTYAYTNNAVCVMAAFFKIDTEARTLDLSKCDTKLTNSLAICDQKNTIGIMRRQLANGMDVHLSWCHVVAKATHFWCKARITDITNMSALANKCDIEYNDMDSKCVQAAERNSK